MKITHSIRGIRHWGDPPNWAPLENLIGDELCGHFMWMFAVGLEDGTRLDAYKHRWTRCYFHLTEDSRTFYYIWRDDDMDEDERYRECEPRVAIEAVFEQWECCEPTESERAALRAALGKARSKSS